MIKHIILISVALGLSGCASWSNLNKYATGEEFEEPVVEQNVYLKKTENSLLPPASGPLPVAVYGFQDKTGQRKALATIASLSSAVTQGADSYLIKALQDVGDSKWFIVLERVGLDNLIKERQMIRQMREQYQGKEAKMLPPMMFAGIILEGGIVGYDSNTTTGGSAVRFLGIGPQSQYQTDTVTVNLRTVSVSTGEVLTSVTVTKSVISYMDKFGLLTFVADGTKSVEAEIGTSVNESINKATAMAIQAAVVDTVREGARKGHWNFKDEKKVEVIAPIPAVIVPVEVKVEPKKEVVPESNKEPVPQVKLDINSTTAATAQ